MCANRECVGPVELSSHPQAYGLHHPWIALGVVGLSRQMLHGVAYERWIITADATRGSLQEVD